MKNKIKIRQNEDKNETKEQETKEQRNGRGIVYIATYLHFSFSLSDFQKISIKSIWGT
jgi:hypothetical protein